VTRIIAIANQKGGVGKTTTAINLGAALAATDKNTLLVDLDPQGALSAGLGVDALRLDLTIYEALLDPSLPLQDIVLPVKPHLDLVPANIELASAEVELVAEIRREFILHRCLQPLKSRYDFILVDCPPSLGLLTVNALCASQEVLIPMQCEYFAMRGMRLLLAAIERVKVRLNPGLELAGILPTMYATGTIHAREVLEEIQSVFGDKVLDVVIHKTIRFAEASVASQAIVEYAGRHRGAEEYTRLAQIIVG
jgi:chromosome partitioning protein